MDNSIHKRESGAQHLKGFLASLQIFDGLLIWLAGLMKLTEEEQRDAGIYVDDQRYK